MRELYGVAMAKQSGCIKILLTENWREGEETERVMIESINFIIKTSDFLQHKQSMVMVD